jgi:uncharacterized protein (TIGR03118 family)
MKIYFRGVAICLALTLIVLAQGCAKKFIDQQLKDFEQVNLVANNSGAGAGLVDPTLQNAWGLAWAPSGIAWVNSQAGHVSELYTGAGAIVRAPVKIPSPMDTVGGNPTGIVFNSVAGFTLSNGSKALFLFVGLDGILSGWNGAANTRALLVKDNSPASVYTGLALDSSGGQKYLYAANFGTGKIDVWDTGFVPVTWMPFHDPAIPSGYAPFNIWAWGTWLYVTYAKVGPGGHEAVGSGEGFVDVFKTDGTWASRFASRGALDAPWGVAVTPAGFLNANNMNTSMSEGGGKVNIASEALVLIGNFGDGKINVFTQNGIFLGQLQSNKKTIVIDDLWALSFPPSTATSIDPDRLYFTAGPDAEKNGLFGYLIKQ